MRRIFKPVVALTAGVALLVLNAAPSAAGSVGTTTGGTLTVNLTPTLTVPLAGSTTSHCFSTGLTVNMVTGTGTTTGTGTISLGLNAEFTYTGNQYLLNGSATGSIAITSGNVAISAITITGITLKTVTTDSTTSTCTPGTPKCSTISANLASGLTGVMTGGLISVPGFTSSTTLIVAGVSTVAAAGCTPPFSALNGKSATVTSWNVHFA